MDEARRYELFVIFQPDLEDEQLEARIDRVNGYLTGMGGEIIEVARKGRRRLAYPINRHIQGIDVIYQANLPGIRLETLERQFNLNEDVIRYLIVRRDDLDKQARAAANAPRAASAQPEVPMGEPLVAVNPIDVAPVAETLAADGVPVDTGAASVADAVDVVTPAQPLPITIVPVDVAPFVETPVVEAPADETPVTQASAIAEEPLAATDTTESTETTEERGE
jgi:small subunit ribosomal protein S6